MDKLGRDWSSLTLEETKPLKPFWSPFLVGAGCGWGTTFPPLLAGWACWGCWGWGGSNLSRGGGENSSCLLGENGSWDLTKSDKNNIVFGSKMSIIKINVLLFFLNAPPRPAANAVDFLYYSTKSISAWQSPESKVTTSVLAVISSGLRSSGYQTISRYLI